MAECKQKLATAAQLATIVSDLLIGNPANSPR